MQRRNAIILLAVSALSGAVLASAPISAQQASLRQQLVGTWSLVSIYNVMPDGRRLQVYGPHPKGIMMLDADGRFARELINPDIPKYAAGSKLQGTPEEYKETVRGVLAHYGTFELDEPAHKLILHFEASSFPNQAGTEQPRTVTIDKDELQEVTPAAVSGGTAHVTWKRVK